PAESGAPHALLAYTAMLAAAALLLRWLRRWPSLGPLALAGSALLVLAWAATHPGTQHAALLLWGAGLALLLGAGAVAPAWRAAPAQRPGDLAVAVGGAMLWLLLVVALEAWIDSKLAAALAAVLATANVGAALRSARLVPDDHRAREAFWLAAGVLV